MSHYLETTPDIWGILKHKPEKKDPGYCALISVFLTAITEQLQFEQNKSFTSLSSMPLAIRTLFILLTLWLFLLCNYKTISSSSATVHL